MLVRPAPSWRRQMLLVQWHHLFVLQLLPGAPILFSRTVHVESGLIGGLEDNVGVVLDHMVLSEKSQIVSVRFQSIFQHAALTRWPFRHSQLT